MMGSFPRVGVNLLPHLERARVAPGDKSGGGWLGALIFLDAQDLTVRRRGPTNFSMVWLSRGAPWPRHQGRAINIFGGRVRRARKHIKR
jgi:hypothetical protein